MNDLIVKKEINKKTDTIIKGLSNFINIPGVNNAFGNRNKIGRTQLAALLSDARNASSVNEIKLYLSYKKAKGHGWDTMCGNKSVAEHLIDAVRRIEEIAEDLKPSIESEQGRVLTEDDMRKVRLMLVEKFLGYLYWKGTEIAN